MKRLCHYSRKPKDLPEVPIRWVKFGASRGSEYTFRYYKGVKFWMRKTDVHKYTTGFSVGREPLCILV